MTFLDLVPWLSGASLIIALGTTLWNIFTGPAAKLAKVIEKVDERVDGLERVQLAHAAQLEQLPDKDSLHELQIVVERMNSDIRVMGETLKGVREISNLMRDWLLEKGVK
tara:strand:+ start:7240 stop:7569 length:330 start_codon:yes stop_codon:yes gene_type:complete